jgi:UDP-N-acetylglucosamine--N-acetylmuramyl-(pentapeptide) pyrophosphoryl-undecaprenol N-acetylglucosamine transferase
MEATRLIIAGGGSGGHFFPAQAIMDEIIRRRKDIEYMYVGSDSGIESRKWTLPAGNRRLLTVKGFKNKTAGEKMSSAFLLVGSMVESRNIIKDFMPDAVLGVGGYASFPIVMAAIMMRIPSAIHEQNSVPGLANKLLSRFVKKIFISFEMSRKYFPSGNTRMTGLPIRYVMRKQKTYAAAVRTILILGGSQGAHQINEMMVKGLDGLVDIKDRVRFIHQTGAADRTYVKSAYDKYGFKADVFDFIDDMAPVFEKADIAVSRAGASTLFELAAYGVPSILIPYPSAASDHQTLNAQEISSHGGAVVIPAAATEPNLLVEDIQELISDEGRIEKMSEAMMKWAKPYAASNIVDEMITLSRKAKACTRG